MPTEHVPRMSAADVDRIRRWHEDAYAELAARGAVTVDYLGRTFAVPATVFGPTPTSDLLGQAVLDEVRAEDRVLDMGTGCGVNAVLAASRARDVVGVDVNPDAVAAAIENAARNGVGPRTTFFESDVFARVEGAFDLMIIDPPFRWFRPRDALEASITDDGYGVLRRFLDGAANHLSSGGRILLFFGTTGDIAFVDECIARAGWVADVVGERTLVKDGVTATYSTRRLTRA